MGKEPYFVLYDAHKEYIVNVAKASGAGIEVVKKEDRDGKRCYGHQADLDTRIVHELR